MHEAHHLYVFNLAVEYPLYVHHPLSDPRLRLSSITRSPLPSGIFRLSPSLLRASGHDTRSSSLTAVTVASGCVNFLHLAAPYTCVGFRAPKIPKSRWYPSQVHLALYRGQTGSTVLLCRLACLPLLR